MKFISRFEWYRSRSYWDRKQRSIWYGTKSYRWEEITREEWDKRFIQHLNPLYELVNKSCYTDNQKVAMISYTYNTWAYAMNINRYIKRCSIKDIKYIMWVYWYNNKWLKKRRYAELSLFNK
jgi:GH24 family phage-related lysozyme (muramidase)